MSNAQTIERSSDKANISAINNMRMDMARYLAFAFCTADALLEMEPSGNIVFANGATQHLFGMSANALIGTPLNSLAAKGEQPLLKALLSRATKGERFNDVRVGFCREVKPNILLSLNGYGVPDLQNHCFVTARVIEAARDESNDGDRNRDSGLLTADAFGGSVKAHFENAAPDSASGELTFVGMAGLTDLEGRLSAGERTLLKNRLGSFLKAVSFEGDSAAQLSAEQFGLLHDAGLDVEGIKTQLSDFAREADPKGIGVSVTANSAGVGDLEVDGKDMAQALLYTIQQVAKEKNAGRVKALTSNISDRLMEAATHIAQVKSTIVSGQFDIAFQPIVALSDEKTHHFEALVRLHDSPINMNPYDFICFAEDNGLIEDFDIALCRKLISRIKTASGSGAILPIAMNISGRSIDSDIFVDQLRAVIAENQDLKKNLLFEITETARISDLERANNVISSFRSDGFEVCLDDFGAGQSAFEYLKALEVDFVKIDGQYVVNATETDKGRAFLVAMSGLCWDLGIQTIAEFVENKETVTFLKECGVGFAQGYLFGKPDSAIDLTGSSRSAINARRKGTRETWA